jgi:hypothetical protein
MGRITISLDAESEAKAKDCAKMMNMPLDQWIADVIRKRISPEWPDSVKRLAGAWPDFPSLDEIRFDEKNDLRREEM